MDNFGATEGATNHANDNGTNGKTKVGIAALRLPQTYAEVRSERRVTTVPIRKPRGQEWVAVAGEPADGLGPLAVITMRDDLNTYVVAPHIVPHLERKEYEVTLLFPTINTSGQPFFWPVRIDREDSWAQSAREAVELARRTWVRVIAQMGAGLYETHTPVGELAEAAWPKASIEDLFDLALKHRLIDSLDHPVLRRLRGDF